MNTFQSEDEGFNGKSVVGFGGATQEAGAVTLSATLEDGGSLPIKIEVLSDSVIRVRAHPESAFGPSPGEEDGLIRSDWARPPSELVEETDGIRVVQGEMCLSVRKDPFGLSFQLGDEVLTGTRPGTGIRLDDETLVLSMDSPEDEKFLGLGYQGARYVYPFSPDWAPFDHRGRSIQMTTLTSHRGYYIPFFMSSRGYGLFLNTLVKTDWDMAKSDRGAYTITIDEPCLDVYFISGPRLKDVLKRYTAIAGRPPLIPKWSLGASSGARLMGIGSENRIPYTGFDVRWFDQKQVESRAREIRENQIPCDHFHFDSAWQTIRGSLEWVSQVYDPAAMLGLLRDMNFKPGLWQRATIEYGDYPLYREGEEKGYLVRGPDGKPFRGVMNQERKVLVDFTNPEALAWWNAKTAAFVRMGVKTYKLDSESGGYSEILPEARDIRFHNGKTGREMENYHGALYLKAAFEGLREALDGKRAVVRAYYPTYFASGRFPYISLGDRTHRCTEEVRMRIAMNLGLAGVPLWVGGDYDPFGLPHVDKALNIRLAPYTYSYWRVAHKTGLPMIRAMVIDFQDEPDAYEADAQFLYGEAFLVAPNIEGSEAAREILPPKSGMNAMAGPMQSRWETGKDWRLVYLPKGEWTNYWTKEKYLGPEWRYFQMNDERPNLFVRGGAIIPFGPMMEWMEEKPNNPLTLEVYPCGESSFELYEDDGETYAYESGGYARTRIRSVDGADGVELEIGAAEGEYDGMLAERDYWLHVYGTPCPTSVMQGEPECPKFETEEDLQGAASGWCFQKSRGYDRIVTIKLSGVRTDVGASLKLVGARAIKYYF